MADSRWELFPLGHWVKGVGHLHFSGGHVATLRMSQADAIETQHQIDGTLGSLDVQWSRAWFQYKEDDVVLFEWKADPELGWPPVRSRDRRRLAAAGHRRGILASLMDTWKQHNNSSPEYCVTALRALHDLALRDVPYKDWQRLARMLEGDDGVSLLRSLLDSAETLDGPDDSDTADADSEDNDTEDRQAPPVHDPPSDNAPPSSPPQQPSGSKPTGESAAPDTLNPSAQAEKHESEHTGGPDSGQEPAEGDESETRSDL